MTVALHRSRGFISRARLTIAILLTTSSLAGAQDRLFALVPHQGGVVGDGGALIEIDTRPGFVGQVRRTIAVPSPGVLPEPYSMGGGRFLVWLSGNGDLVNLFDTLTNRLATLPGLVPAGSKLVAVDSARMRIFAASNAGIHILDGSIGTIRFVSLPLRTPFVQGTYASAAERLFVGRSFDAVPAAIDVIDVVGARVESSFRLGTTGVTGLAVDADGHRVFVAATSRVSVYDAAGALLTQAPVLGSFLFNERNALQIDQSRRRLMVTTVNTAVRPDEPLGARVVVFDLDTFALLGVAAGQDPFWGEGSGTPFHMLTGPRSPVYVFSSFLAARNQCDTARFEVLDPSSGARQQRVEVSRLWGASLGTSVCNAFLVLQSPPSAPTLQAPVISGRQVTLSWTASTDVVHYDLEVGIAPARRDLVTSTTGTTFVADGVPPGTYHVRIRAINVVGRSLPSNEVTIAVP